MIPVTPPAVAATVGRWGRSMIDRAAPAQPHICPKSIINYPNIKRFPGGDSNDLVPNLKNPKDPVPSLDVNKPPSAKGAGG